MIKSYSLLHKKSHIEIYSSRLQKIKTIIKKKGMEGFLITNTYNIRYLCGFTGSTAMFLITRERDIFVTDFRYKEQATSEVIGCDIFIGKGEMIKTVKHLLLKTKTKRLGVEYTIPYYLFRYLSKANFDIIPKEGLVEKFRQKKDAFELENIECAVKRAEDSFCEVKPFIKKGVRERTIALRLEERLKRNGCRNIPFDIIVASGSNAAMPHAKPTEKKIEEGDFIIIDWGGEANGYFSDITRTLLVKGNRLNEKRRLYQIVLDANKRAIDKVLPGVLSKDIDYSAREVIRRAGYGQFFGHACGHGVGLQVHELPKITWNKKETIIENMVFTIEPGIYLPKVGGVRIEDMVLVKSNRTIVLTTLPKELEIIS